MLLVPKSVIIDPLREGLPIAPWGTRRLEKRFKTWQTNLRVHLASKAERLERPHAAHGRVQLLVDRQRLSHTAT